MTKDEWKTLFTLRDELEDPADRLLLRRFIRYVERLEAILRIRKKEE